MSINYTWVGSREPVTGVQYNQPVTHGDQLTVNDVGPWALQAVPKGTEVYQSMTGPGRGFWRFDVATEFTTDTAWPGDANDSSPSILNDPDLHEGKVTGSPVTIDGYQIPVGTYICQFRDFPDGYDFYCQGTSLPILFRGCRFRFTAGLGGSGLFNDNTSTAAQHILMHYCDVGLTAADIPAEGSGLMHIKWLGGSNHRIHRGYHSYSSTFIQPNTQGCRISETMLTDIVFHYGEAGTSGNGPDATTGHNNGISSEGALTALEIERCRIVFASPDPATGSNGFTAAGQSGYGTQPGQLGYGNGTQPGRVVGQTDCIALFAINGANVGSSPGAIAIRNNLLGGTGVSLYAGNAGGGAQNIHVTGNRWTTRYWPNGGQFGAITDTPAWGSNGNTQSDNLWADDYGTASTPGSTALANRQYPTGNGPRVGTSVI